MCLCGIRGGAAAFVLHWWVGGPACCRGEVGECAKPFRSMLTRQPVLTVSAVRAIC